MRIKPLEVRLREVITLRTKLDDLGLGACDGVKTFYGLAQDFVKQGWGSSGFIKVPEADRVLHYQLTTREGVESRVWLKASRS